MTPMSPLALSLAAVIVLAACAKKPADPALESDAAPTAPVSQADPAPGAPTASDATADTPAEDTPEARNRAEQQEKLDYATMEDGYLGDAEGQWAVSATASSAFGEAGKEPPESQAGNTPWRATGAPNGDDWTNNSQNIGFDWIQLKYDQAVEPAEIRAVLSGNEAAESITKIELIDTTGSAHVIWSGLSDTKRDDRGQRTWFVRKIDNAAYTADTVKLTFANNVASGYKTVDAVQLVGK